MPRHIVILAIVIVAALTALAAPVQAAIRDDRGRFLFEPLTRNQDPVNLIQIGGTPGPAQGPDENCRFSDGRIARTPLCFAKHAGEAWKRGEMKERNAPRCNGKDTLTFRSRPPRGDKNNRSTSTTPTCKTQFHLRMWDDDAVNTPYGEWSLGVVYHETRGFCSFCDPDLSQFPPGFETKGDHVVDEHWENVENVALWEFSIRTDGEDRYCVQHDYRPVPGQFVGRDKRGLFNNGRISRISVQKPDENAPNARRCVGR